MNAIVANARRRQSVGKNPSSSCPSGAAMFSDQAWQEIAHRLRLSGQELRIIRGVFDGRKESAIAFDLGISPHTVHTHFERLHRKLAVTDRVELVLRIMEEFLVLAAYSMHVVPPASAY